MRFGRRKPPKDITRLLELAVEAEVIRSYRVLETPRVTGLETKRWAITLNGGVETEVGEITGPAQLQGARIAQRMTQSDGTET